MKSQFFLAKYLRSEFDAFIAQETLVPFEGLTWQFPRSKIKPYDDVQILRKLWSFPLL